MESGDVIRPKNDSEAIQQVAFFLKEGEPDRLIQMAVGVKEYSWSDIASRTALAYEAKSAKARWNKDSEGAAEAKKRADQYREFSRRLSLKATPSNKARIPNTDEMRAMFGETALNMGKSKPNR